MSTSTVYVVTYASPYVEDVDVRAEVIGVFSSYERAEQAIAGHAHTRPTDHEITEHEVR